MRLYPFCLWADQKISTGLLWSLFTPFIYNPVILQWPNVCSEEGKNEQKSPGLNFVLGSDGKPKEVHEA